MLQHGVGHTASGYAEGARRCDWTTRKTCAAANAGYGAGSGANACASPALLLLQHLVRRTCLQPNRVRTTQCHRPGNRQPSGGARIQRDLRILQHRIGYAGGSHAEIQCPRCSSSGESAATPRVHASNRACSRKGLPRDECHLTRGIDLERCSVDQKSRVSTSLELVLECRGGLADVQRHCRCRGVKADRRASERGRNPLCRSSCPRPKGSPPCPCP